ncbi:16S rRNA processing protein RimM [hydrothermal vent metagenome]|uniref:16S rRNA processing protein RimM n=1 Tax=hydrothermal vent metagenome TaxID=652676 RepID=A0A3B0T2E6_9ZZZZ
MNKQSERLVVLGIITGVHGVGGMVKVKSFTQDPYGIGEYGPLLLGDTDRLLEIVHMQPHKDVFLVQFEGVVGRDAAEALKGLELRIEREKLPDPEDDEFYFADLVGLVVKRDDDQVIGKIVDVVNFGAGDLLEIAFDGRKKTELLAFNEATVPVVDMASGFVVVDPPNWLLPDVEGEE